MWNSYWGLHYFAFSYPHNIAFLTPPASSASLAFVPHAFFPKYSRYWGCTAAEFWGKGSCFKILQTDGMLSSCTRWSTFWRLNLKHCMAQVDIALYSLPCAYRLPCPTLNNNILESYQQYGVPSHKDRSFPEKSLFIPFICELSIGIYSILTLEIDLNDSVLC